MSGRTEDGPDALPEVDTDPSDRVGPEGQSVVGERPSGAPGRPPPVLAGDVGAVDVVERSLHRREQAERRPEGAVVGDGDAVLAGPYREWEPERGQAGVDGIRKEIGHRSLLLACAHPAPVRATQ